MNKVNLVGNLGADVEVRYTEGGSAIATMRLATANRPVKGEKQPPTWHTVKAFGKAAEVLAEHGKKGKSLAITGRINNGSYDKDGETRYFSEVVCDEFEFLGGSGKPAEGGEDLPSGQSERDPF
ncbi:single-stranded DNA-binding protein [Rhodanobacter sp. 115]|uniref:single-stranded DNA-binding protein n=1 Tax=Rhodanobacter sp. FW021-MT20 TaxID=1162282 RepID=UPI0034E4DEC1